MSTRGSRWLKVGLRSSMADQGLLKPKEDEVIMDPNRTLSDADVEAIVKVLIKEWQTTFYQGLGKGLWGMVQKVFVTAVVLACLWYYARGGK